MPIVSSQYKAPVYLPGGMLQTLIAARLPRPNISFQRERLELEDGDFLDLDWLNNKSDRLIIVTHGLEGSSRSQYVTDICRQMDHSRYDLLAWNCRSCSGEMNRLKKLYHHGEIEDISTVLDHVISLDRYKKIYLAGISMGGNISIKFLALKKQLAEHISACGVVSTPCDLAAASSAMDRSINYFLRKYFKKNLKKKLVAKNEQYPNSFPMEKFDKMKTWREFDEVFVAPFIGFNSVDEFYFQASANSFIDQVETPLFLINAKNDPVLTDSCHPTELARKSRNTHLELSSTGGHAYFPMMGKNYAASRIINYFDNH